VVGAIEGLEKIRVVNSFSLVARERRSGPRSHHDRGWCDWGRRLCFPRLDLSFFESRGRKAAAVSRPSDMADGEREAFNHGRGSWDDDHLVRLGSCTHTPTWCATVDES